LTGKTYYDDKINSAIALEQQYLHASVLVLGYMIRFVNLYPMTFKGKIMKGNSGNLRSNMFIYKQVGENAMENVVTLVEDGDIGAFNRSNRSIHHMIEN